VRVQSGEITASKVNAAALADAAAPAWAYDDSGNTVTVKTVDPFAPGVVQIAAATEVLGDARPAAVALNQISVKVQPGQYLQIVLPAAFTHDNPVTMQVLAANGALLKTCRLTDRNASNVSVSTGDWPSGVYLIRFTSGNISVPRRVVFMR
jgi:hypothetical protein